MTSGHLMCGMSYFDFICTSLEANQRPKNGVLGYDMKHTKMNEWSKEDSSSHSDLRGHISLVSTYIDWSTWLRQFWDVNMEVVELIWIEFESRHFVKLSIYSGYMMKRLNYIKILTLKGWSNQLIFLIFG